MKSFADHLAWRTGIFVSLCLVIAALVWILRDMGHLQIGGTYSSQMLFIPFLSGYLLWNERERIFVSPEAAPWKGAQFTVGAVIAGLLAFYFNHLRYAYLFSAISLVSAVLLVVAGFVTVYGSSVLRRASFPLGLLLLAVSFPDSIVQGIVSILQSESAWLSAALFSLIGVPVYKQGFLLSVPGVTIEIARECSGINSSIALVLIMVLVARQSLASNWRRAVLVAATIPLSILKNAIRITTLTMLALRVDPSFLTGRLHHQGGFVFFLVAMALMYPVWKLLKRGDGIDCTIPELTGWNASGQPAAQNLHTDG